MKTKRARTAGKLVTANTTVLNSVISRPTSFAVFAVMLGTWPAIVLTANVVRIGATIVVLLGGLAPLVWAMVMPWIVNMSNSCKNSVVPALPWGLLVRRVASKLVLDVTVNMEGRKSLVLMAVL
jgi:hypothetical protein